MKRLRASALAGAGIAATILTLHAPSYAADETFAADTRDYLRRLEKLGFSGVVLAASGDDTLVAVGCGLADRERGIRWSPGTVSTIGSITKQFTGAAILALAEEGRLSTDDTLTDHFDDVPDDKRDITLHQLLTHSSGVMDVDGLGDWTPITRDAYVRRALDQELAFAPGTDYAYSNAGYSLLGAIIEQVTGRSYEAYVRDRLFAPQGIYETGYVLAPWGDDRMAQGYARSERWGTVLERPIADDGPYWVLRANGGMHSTAFDMLRWGRALLDGRPLNAESMTRYWAPHVAERGGSHYGYGWSVVDRDGTRVITHNGGNSIHFANMAVIPDADAVIFLQCSVIADFALADSLLDQVAQRLLDGRPYPAVPDVAEEADGPRGDVTGTYSIPDGEFHVSADDGGLWIEASGPRAFARLHSTRPVDVERCDRFSARIDHIVSSWLDGDFEPLFEAYRRSAPIERLRANREDEMRDAVATLGTFHGHEVLGTALRSDRDGTLVRFRFERGHRDRLYVWDAEADEHLLGYSRRGMDVRLRCVPVVGGGFASWNPDDAASRSVRFAVDADGRSTVELGGDDVLVGVRR